MRTIRGRSDYPAPLAAAEAAVTASAPFAGSPDGRSRPPQAVRRWPPQCNHRAPVGPGPGPRGHGQIQAVAAREREGPGIPPAGALACRNGWSPSGPTMSSDAEELAGNPARPRLGARRSRPGQTPPSQPLEAARGLYEALGRRISGKGTIQSRAGCDLRGAGPGLLGRGTARTDRAAAWNRAQRRADAGYRVRNPRARSAGTNRASLLHPPPPGVAGGRRSRAMPGAWTPRPGLSGSPGALGLARSVRAAIRRNTAADAADCSSASVRPVDVYQPIIPRHHPGARRRTRSTTGAVSSRMTEEAIEDPALEMPPSPP